MIASSQGLQLASQFPSHSLSPDEEGWCRKEGGPLQSQFGGQLEQSPQVKTSANSPQRGGGSTCVALRAGGVVMEEGGEKGKSGRFINDHSPKFLAGNFLFSAT